MAAIAFWWLASANASWSARCHVVLDRDALGVGAHVAVLDRAPQAVVDGRVDERPVAEAVAEARVRQEVRRAVHRFHAAGDDDLGITGLDLGRGQHDRLETRAADPVDGRRRGRVREPGLQRRLASRRLADASLEDLAHQDVVDPSGRRVEPGALDRGADGDPAELDRGTALSAPPNLPIGVRTALTM